MLNFHRSMSTDTSETTNTSATTETTNTSATTETSKILTEPAVNSKPTKEQKIQCTLVKNH